MFRVRVHIENPKLRTVLKLETSLSSSILPQKGMVMKLMMRAQMSQPLPSPDLNISDGADDDRRLPCPIRFVNNYYMNLVYIIAKFVPSTRYSYHI